MKLMDNTGPNCDPHRPMVLQVYEVIVLVALLPISYIKNVKHFAPLSFIANIASFLGLAVIREYTVLLLILVLCTG